MAGPIVLVPFRAPGRGKTRLAPELDGDARGELATAMLADVVAAVRAAGVDRILGLVRGGGAEQTVRRLGLEVVPDPRPGAGLDGAVAAAVGDLSTPARVAVVMADLPRITAADVAAVLDRDDAVVVAPTVDGGTAVLLRRPGDIIPTSYGPGSARRHVALARERGLHPAVVQRPGLAHDVDTPGDLAALADGGVGPRTTEVLARLPADQPPG